MTTQPQDSEVEAVALAIERADQEPCPDHAGFDHPEISDWGIHLATAAINALSMHRASLSGGGEVERLRDILDTERYKVAVGVQAILAAIEGRRWLSEGGRGSYTYDDERYQQEFGAALQEIEVALAPLRSIARDWSDCPTDPLRVAANRIAALTIPSSPEGGR